MLICFPWKGSGGGVVYGFGVWRVKSWVKNVLNTNKYIAIFSIKWGWSPLTYLPLVVIIFEKSIILFYWTPYRGIDTSSPKQRKPSSSYTPIEPLIGGLILFHSSSFLTMRNFFPLLNPLLGDWDFPPMLLSTFLRNYWTPYRGIDTLFPP